MPRMPSITIRMPHEDQEWVRQLAAKSGMTRSAVMKLGLAKLRNDPPVPMDDDEQEEGP